MYHYDEYDHALVKDRVAQFRRQVERRLSGDLTEEQFRPLRLMNGLYLQLHAYMLRVAIPYGTLDSRQLRKLAYIARRYDKGYGHFTTRQNLQYNWPKLEETPDILAELAEVEMHAIQTSGNCIRNTTSDQYAGAAADEIEDPRIWCEIVRQWSTLHPEFSFLPRKFKVAITGSENDRAAVRVHDIGLIMKHGDGEGAGEAGEVGFEVIVGGGLGRTPFLGKTIRPFLAKEDLLSYLEAILRTYNMLGRRDNKYKARIKVTLHETGAEEFARLVEEEWAEIKESSLKLPKPEMDRIAAHFVPPEFRALESRATAEEERAAGDPAFASWVRNNIVEHKASGYAIANISLKPVGLPPGDATSEQMDLVADLADEYSFGEIRVTHTQNLVLPHVERSRLPELYDRLLAAGLATANVGLLSDIICCPGLDYCTLASARSIPISTQISERFADQGRLDLVGQMQIKISGCINACGHHHVGHIGILGVDRKGEEHYQIQLGGSASEDASLGKILGRGFSADQVVDVVEQLVDVYVELREGDERFIDTYRRVGQAPFKEKVYGTA
ncbi:MAG: nitrite/sulfite reductase [Myxococcales bacterium]|nr:nitrite/sulfite reductase [Myxococcales bacterium]HIK86537.1 nitrite/sulfite reductase [Myxococcales bacterium]